MSYIPHINRSWASPQATDPLRLIQVSARLEDGTEVRWDKSSEGASLSIIPLEGEGIGTTISSALVSELVEAVSEMVGRKTYVAVESYEGLVETVIPFLTEAEAVAHKRRLEQEDSRYIVTVHEIEAVKSR